MSGWISPSELSTLDRSNDGVVLGLGALVGSLLGGDLLAGNGLTGREVVTFLGGVVALMLTAGLAAAVGPALRGLRAQPIEALKEE